MSAPPGSRPLRNGDRPSGRPSEGLVAELLWIAVFTLTSMVVAGILVTIGLRIAAADQPHPWDAVVIKFAGILVEAAPIVGAFLAIWGGLGALLFLILAFWTRAGTAKGLRSKPERTTGGGERP